jgi:nucleotide-binding universal stress UspA family protein
VAIGDPAEAILAETRETETAAIVMATHGRGPLPRILFGSVTAAVVKASPVPVLTVHPSAARRPPPGAAPPG